MGYLSIFIEKSMNFRRNRLELLKFLYEQLKEKQELDRNVLTESLKDRRRARHLRIALKELKEWISEWKNSIKK